MTIYPYACKIEYTACVHRLDCIKWLSEHHLVAPQTHRNHPEGRLPSMEAVLDGLDKIKRQKRNTGK